ncbi:Proteasome subunit alpha type-4 [Bienertia sinuspersici]
MVLFWLTSTSSEKMYKIDDHVACAITGIMDNTSLTSEKLKLAEVKYHVHSPNSLNKLLAKSRLAQPAAKTA